MLASFLISTVASSLLSLGSAAPGRQDKLCGFGLEACPRGTFCYPYDRRCDDLKKCNGTCLPYNSYASCGWGKGMDGTCPRHWPCVYDTRNLPPVCDNKNCRQPSICVHPNVQSCGGIAGRGCRMANHACFDDPRDTCWPTKGGYDCAGICL